MMSWLALGLGCAPDATPPASETRCAVQAENALRVDCETPTPTTLHLQSAHESRSLPVEGAFTLSGLAAATTWEWSTDDDAGSFTTGALPANLPTLDITGTSTIPYVFLVSSPWAIIVDTQGDIVWYEAVSSGWSLDGGVSAYAFTPEEEVLIVSRSEIVSRALSGEVRQRIAREDRALHHDIFRADGLTYVLNAEVHSYPSGDFVVDGFYVYDTHGLRVAEWDLADHLTEDPIPVDGPSNFWSLEFPGAEDLAHANGIFAAPDGTILLSLRHFDAVWALDGVDHPNFGEVQWILGGPQSDFEIRSAGEATDLMGPHHPRIDGDTVTVFDNRDPGNARTLALSLDAEQRIAEVTRAHALDETCSIQGANYPLPSGNVLVTCGDTQHIRELDPSGETVWALQIEGAAAGYVARGIPLLTSPTGW